MALHTTLWDKSDHEQRKIWKVDLKRTCFFCFVRAWTTNHDGLVGRYICRPMDDLLKISSSPSFVFFSHPMGIHHGKVQWYWEEYEGKSKTWSLCKIYHIKLFPFFLVSAVLVLFPYECQFYAHVPLTFVLMYQLVSRYAMLSRFLANQPSAPTHVIIINWPTFNITSFHVYIRFDIQQPLSFIQLCSSDFQITYSSVFVIIQHLLSHSLENM